MCARQRLKTSSSSASGLVLRGGYEGTKPYNLKLFKQGTPNKSRKKFNFFFSSSLSKPFPVIVHNQLGIQSLRSQKIARLRPATSSDSLCSHISMAGSSKRKRSTKQSDDVPAAPIVNTHLTATIPLRSRASASAEPRTLTIDQAVDLGVHEQQQQQQQQQQKLQTTQSTTLPAQDHDASDSDDAAPEAISLSASKAQLRARDAAQTQAIRDAESRSRHKRKERQLRLDEQARQRRQLAAQTSLSSADDDNNDVDDDHENDEQEDTQQTNDLLPTALLAQLSDVRPPTPPPDDKAPSQRSSARTHNARLLKRGAVTLPSSAALQQQQQAKSLELPGMSVRVLARRNERLPPPRGRSGENSVITSWMQGRNSIAASIRTHGKGVKVRSGRVTRRPYGLKTGFA